MQPVPPGMFFIYKYFFFNNFYLTNLGNFMNDYSYNAPQRGSSMPVMPNFSGGINVLINLLAIIKKTFLISSKFTIFIK